MSRLKFGQYMFYGYGNFCTFCKVNRELLFTSSDDGTIEAIKDQVDILIKAHENTKGGCPCNKRKRREVTLKAYKETVEIMLKNPTIKTRICNLLNNAKEVLFLEGSISGNPSPNRQDPFAVIKNEEE